MKSTLYIGMGITLLSFMGFIGIICMVGVLISVASDRGLTWEAFKERLPTFLMLVAYLVIVALLVYVVIFLTRYYGA
jgi:hypothetical protein